MSRRPPWDDDEYREPGLFEEPPPPPPPGRGPFFPKGRYPEGEVETERFVPGYDPLRRDRLTGLTDLPFEHVVDGAGDKVFEDRGHGHPIPALLSLSLCSAAVGMGLRPLAPYLTDPRITVVWAFICVGLFIWAMKQKATFTLAVRVAFIVPLFFVLTHVVSFVDRAGHEGHVAVVIALALTAFTVDAFTNHWARMLFATGALEADSRLEWTAQWRSRWTPRWVVRRSDRSGTTRAAWALIFYPLGYAPLWWLFLNAGREDALVAVPVGIIGLGLLLGLRAGLAPTLLRPFQSLGRAVYSWFFYGVRGMHAPGVLRAPAGPIQYRVALLAAALTLLSATLLPPGEEIANGVNLAGLGPLAQFATLAVLFAKLVLFPLLVSGGVVISAALPVFSALEDLTNGTADERAARQVDYFTKIIATSKDDIVGRQTFYGFHATEGYPVVVSSAVAEGHESIRGGSGSGKTSLAILLRVKQWLSRTGPRAACILIVDQKPDLNLLFSVKKATESAGRKFRFFTNLPGHSTHVFNVIDELRSSGQPLVRGASALHSSLGLEAGAGYGRSHFSAISRGLLRMMLRYAPESRSLREVLAAWLRHRPTLRPEERRQEEKAYEAMLSLETLAEKPELNCISGRAFDERISMTRAVAENEVIYIALDPKAEGEAVARFIGSLATECFYQAILRHNSARDEKGRRLFPFKRGFAALDEFSILADRQWGNFLEAARERGLSLLLACQTVQTLWPELRQAVETNTAVKQIFTARTPQELKDLAALGGTTIRAVFDLEGGMKGRESDRLSRNLLKTMSAEPDLSVLVIEKTADYAQFDGFPVLIRTPHCQSKAEYEASRAADWPVYDGLMVVGEEAAPARGTNVVPMPLRAGAVAPAPASRPAAGRPAQGTPLAAMFDALVLPTSGEASKPGDEEEQSV